MIRLDYRNMDDYIADPIEYRFVDEVIVVDDEANGKKMVSSQDWYFKMHFPGNPVMPGVFVMEAIMQTAAYILTTRDDVNDKLVMFNGCNSMRLFDSVYPGNILETNAKLKSYRNGVAFFNGKGVVNEKTVCTMDFTMVLPNILSKFNEKRSLNIKKGDILLVHSGMDGLESLGVDSTDIITFLKEIVGDSGTLVFPVYPLKNI